MQSCSELATKRSLLSTLKSGDGMATAPTFDFSAWLEHKRAAADEFFFG
jgi:hypothetical protein